MNIQNDFLRLTKSDPLVLKITALTDFCGLASFERRVLKSNLLIFHIDKLSRFGSELFEFSIAEEKSILSLV